MRIAFGLMVVTVLSLSVYSVIRSDPPAVDDVIAADSELIEPPTTQSRGELISTSSTLNLEFGAPVPEDPFPPSTLPSTTTTIANAPSSGDDSAQPDRGEGGESEEQEVGEEPPPTPGPAEKGPSGPIQLSGESGMVIEGLTISNPDGHCVVIKQSTDVVIRNSNIGPCGGHAVVIEQSSSVRVEGLRIDDSTSGVYALDSQAVAVIGNIFQNAGRNFVQFDKVTGGGNIISGNSGANKLGASNAEDMVNVYQSSGTASSPLMVSGNAFRDGGPSSSGSGIMVGDNGGSHIVVRENTLFNPGQVGIGVPGGTSIKVLGNSVFSNSHAWSNVGIYVWNQSGGSCGDIEVRGNSVEWYAADGSPNPSWDGGNCGTVNGWDENNWTASLG